MQLATNRRRGFIRWLQGVENGFLVTPARGEVQENVSRRFLLSSITGRLNLARLSPQTN
jgi:hypothetical protein